MSNRPPPLDSGRLHTFAVVARELGFSRAARVLGRTQSSVSQAVSLLERELGTTLFERRGRGVALTDGGRLLLPHTTSILEEMEHARAHLEAARELRAGELLIGTSDTLACHVLPPVLAAFRARHPGVELRLDNRPSPATAAAVAERQVHVGLVSLPLPGELAERLGGRIRVQPLAAQADVLICPPDHPLAGRRRVALGDLLPYPLLLLARHTGSRAYLEAALERLAERPKVVMEMSSVEVLKRLCELGFGLSVVPACAIAREVASGTLAARPLEGLGPGRSVGLVTPAAVPLPRATAAFAALAADMVPRADPDSPRSSRPGARPRRTK